MPEPMASVAVNMADTAEESGRSIRIIRQAIGYTLDEAALTSGLTVEELAALEDGDAYDAAKIHRVAVALGHR